MDIGRASRASGVSLKMIRHYETIGLLPRIDRTRGNYRVYSVNDVDTLRFIKRARTLGFSTEDIRQLLGLWQDRSRTSVTVKRLAGKHIEELKRKLADLEAMLETIEDLASRSHAKHHFRRPIAGALEKSPPR